MLLPPSSTSKGAQVLRTPLTGSVRSHIVTGLCPEPREISVTEPRALCAGQLSSGLLSLSPAMQAAGEAAESPLWLPMETRHQPCPSYLDALGVLHSLICT